MSNSSLASAQRELADIKTELACGICRGVRRVTHTYVPKRRKISLHLLTR